ncbi:hypothetical protein RRF57_010046 [Xylaria bambusicola]|uniref:Nephrocystin 3-like N-terminal domain-containing protein n=1 Tax=Xylaria bambusicola TaxID=326684 RepID=A0AAN7URV1_9PEZI
MLKDGTDDGTSLLPKEKDGTNSKKRIYLVIDALDEVPLQHSHDVLTFLQELATASLPHLNLLITSRYDSRIEVTLGGASFWRIIPIMKESVKEDIELYVNKFVHDDTRLSKLCKKSITLKELMHEKFVEKGNGM